ncbi:malto-oligosyltrehalose synthase [Dongia soli]|uniref:4-alpha-glucanotransferase n=1 Tax=Dongia soli TaxID=600628 RepID=A0ABU5E6Z9_9PROT|nr:malto-oligosyltrehalose synthase [Dongia soli]MDY0881631.1 malto-oligosyltrehalose synthase [Dongia soli]
MTSPDHLDQICLQHGIQRRYQDHSGNLKEVSEQTLGRLAERLSATEATGSRPIILQHERGELGHIRLEQQKLPLTPLRWEIETEDGDHLSGDVELVDGIVTIPCQLPFGDHRLTIFTRDDDMPVTALPVIVAPQRCFLPPALSGTGRLWGISVQLFALRSQRNWGIGDFTDLADLIGYAAASGAATIGLNPLHALFPDHPDWASPYAPSSRHFLNTIYIDPEAMPEFAECDLARGLRNEPAFERKLQRLRAEPLVDYAGVTAVKQEILELLFHHFREHHLGKSDPFGREFRAFQHRHGQALRDFATFHALQEYIRKNAAQRLSWHDWPEQFHDPDGEAVRAFARDHAPRIEFFEYLQWHAHRQLLFCRERARQTGMAIGLYRDIAVGVARNSAETWAAQDYIVDDWSVGAPPDNWNPGGQNWGIPPAHPRLMAESGYADFRAVLRANMYAAGAVRIDHVLGLMRLFWIPPDAGAGDGAYVQYPLQDLIAMITLESWRQRCMVIGEDLGTVPEGLQEQLAAAGILSYRLLYFERDAEGQFKKPTDWPDLALATVTTHDLPTLPSYWKGIDIALKARLGIYTEADAPEKEGKQRARDRLSLLEALRSEGLLPGDDGNVPVEAVHRYLARTRSKLVMLQLEDMLDVVEQMNVPGTVDEHPNWRHKLPRTIDEIMTDSRVRQVLGAVAEERVGNTEETGKGPISRDITTIPTATYRLQLNKDMTFAQATELIPYLRAVGVSHIYASPYLKARPNSPHGYDITDHNSLNPEIGDWATFSAFCTKLRQEGLGQILDFIPNHMGIGHADNAYWLDVLEWGRGSAFAAFFDINWTPRQAALQGKVLLPLLGGQYGHVLERGELELKFDAASGSFSVWYFDHRFPLHPSTYPLILQRIQALDDFTRGFAAVRPPTEESAPRSAERAVADGLKQALAETAQRDASLSAELHAAAQAYNGSPGQPDSFRNLHDLLERQVYRLAFWRVAAEEINYRRFFDINELAGIRMERWDVFSATHRLIGRLVAEGKLQGLRLDHVDGLFDPATYLDRLQSFVQRHRDEHGAGGDRRQGAASPFYILVEKITARHERLRDSWPVAGTTGYECLNLVNGLFVSPNGERALDRAYRQFIDEPVDYETMLYTCKTHIIDTVLNSEIERLSGELDKLSEQHWTTRDYTQDRLRAALREVVAGFPVYRTYINKEGISSEDHRDIDWAVSQARKTYRGLDPEILDFVQAALTATLSDRHATYRRQDVLKFAMRFQQYTGPVMAKALEDTLFYRYNRLLSLNEVGGEPRQFGISDSAFHHLMQERAKLQPHALSTLATHDTKRGADMRARLNVLSEMPAEWNKRLRRWATLNRFRRQKSDRGSMPTRNDEYMIYQMLLGAWPVELMARTALSPDDVAAFRGRLCNAILKAIREAKQHTSWHNQNEPYEAACLAFLEKIIDVNQRSPFLDDFLPFQARIAKLGMLKSLSQLAVSLTIPGVPDIYQGGELWDLNMMDPDNRRPVDFQTRVDFLKQAEAVMTLPPSERRIRIGKWLGDWLDGRIKLVLTSAILNLRRREPELFLYGGYEPLAIGGEQATRLFGFVRRYEGKICVTLCGRFFAGATEDADELDAWRSIWAGCSASLPVKEASLLDIMTGAPRKIQDGNLQIDDILTDLPVAILFGQEGLGAA